MCVGHSMLLTPGRLKNSVTCNQKHQDFLTIIYYVLVKQVLCVLFFPLCVFLKHISFWIKWSTHQTVAWFMWRPWFCIPGSHIGLVTCVGVSLGTEQFYMLSLMLGVEFVLSYQHVLFWNNAELVSLEDGCWPIRCTSQDTQVYKFTLDPMQLHLPVLFCFFCC